MKKTRAVQPPPAAPAKSAGDVWIYVLLFLAAAAAYFQVAHFSFVNYDDPFYVSQNPHVRGGLSASSIAWAFTSGEGANWFPLTRISHLVDAQLFGMESGWHHVTNLLLHALSTVLLFAFLQRSTRARWPSAFVSLVFAIHPLHVESVAWISERKDVLCTFFWMLTLWAYVRYTERPDRLRYLLVLLTFCLGLMSKPMILSLPLLLILWDVWPLSRRQSWVEKLPFFILAAGAGVTTFLVQQAGGAVREFSAIPLGLRVENALVSYLVYIYQMVWPSGLAVFYPYPADIPLWQPALAAGALLGVSAAVLRSLRSRPYLAVGWFWYIVTLAPVIGIVQVGGQARADRYMYVPMIGLTILLAWGVMDLLKQRPAMQPVITAAAVLAGIACFALTVRQVQFWSDSVALFQHAVDVTEDNYLAQHNLGSALLEAVRLPDAVAHLQAALKINPGSAAAHTDLGSALAQLPGRLPEAIAEYRTALRIDPNLAIPHNNLGQALLNEGKTTEAIGEYEAALRLQPGNEQARTNLQRARQEASSGDTEYNEGLKLAKTPGRLTDAITHFEAALRLNPNNAEAHNNLGFALTNFPARLPEAIAHFEAALRINPDYADAHYNLGVALSNMPGRMPEAIRHLEASERLKPDPELEQVLKRLKGH